MKAIRVHQFGEPDVLKLEDVPDPVAGPGELVVRLHAVGVNPVETYIRRGIYGPREFPFTPGSDAAGVVESVGTGVAKYKVGDRVYLSGSKSGTYAAKALCDASHVHPLPDTCSFAQGAAVGVPYATAYRGLFQRGSAKGRDVILVHGASGGVGIAAVQMARHTGLQVIGTAGSEAGLQLVRDQGADHVLDHARDGYLDEVMRLTDGRGVDVILEMLANMNLGKDLTILAKHGRVVVIGSRGDVTITPRETMRRDADIRGMTLMNASAEDLAEIHAALVVGLRNGSLKPVIQTEMPLAEAAEAHRLVIEGKSTGKIVLMP